MVLKTVVRMETSDFNPSEMPGTTVFPTCRPLKANTQLQPTQMPTSTPVQQENMVQPAHLDQPQHDKRVDKVDDTDDDDNEPLVLEDMTNHLLNRIESETIHPPANSQVASLNRELKSLETRYFRTRLQLEKASIKTDQMRQQMSKMKDNDAKKDHQLQKLRSLIDRIQAEKRQLEQQAIHNRDYAKKIEQRFCMGIKGQSVAQRNLQLCGRIKELELQVEEHAKQLADQKTQQEQLQSKNAILSRALETRFDQLELNGSLHNGILFEIARLQEECERFALQLAQEKQQVQLQERALAKAHEIHDELQQSLALEQANVAALEQDKASLQAQLHKFQTSRRNFELEKATLLKYIHQQAEQIFATQNELQQLKQQHATKESMWQQQLSHEQSKQQQLQETLESRNAMVCELERNNQVLENAFQDQQQQSHTWQSRHDLIEARTTQLQDQVRDTEQQLASMRQLVSNLEQDKYLLQQQNEKVTQQLGQLSQENHHLSVENQQKTADERILRKEMEKLLNDMEQLSCQRNEATRAMHEAVGISASSLEEQQALEKRLESQRKQLDQLKNAKALLQNAMLEQLAAVRKQLQLEKMQRVELEAKVKQYQAMQTPPQVTHQSKTSALATAAVVPMASSAKSANPFKAAIAQPAKPAASKLPQIAQFLTQSLAQQGSPTLLTAMSDDESSEEEEEEAVELPKVQQALRSPPPSPRDKSPSLHAPPLSNQGDDGGTMNLTAVLKDAVVQEMEEPLALPQEQTSHAVVPSVAPSPSLSQMEEPETVSLLELAAS